MTAVAVRCSAWLGVAGIGQDALAQDIQLGGRRFIALNFDNGELSICCFGFKRVLSEESKQELIQWLHEDIASPEIKQSAIVYLQFPEECPERPEQLDLRACTFDPRESLGAAGKLDRAASPHGGCVPSIPPTAEVDMDQVGEFRLQLG